MIFFSLAIFINCKYFCLFFKKNKQELYKLLKKSEKMKNSFKYFFCKFRLIYYEKNCNCAHTKLLDIFLFKFFFFAFLQFRAIIYQILVFFFLLLIFTCILVSCIWWNVYFILRTNYFLALVMSFNNDIYFQRTTEKTRKGRNLLHYFMLQITKSLNF